MLNIIQIGPAAPLWRSSWIEMTGRDAQDFLHRLSTARIKSLQPGEGAPSCFLTATGKIRSHHMIWCIEPESYGIEFDPGTDDRWKAELLQFIEQFTFSEKFALTEFPEFESLLLIGPEAGERVGGLKAYETRELAPGIRACHRGSDEFGQPSVRIHGKQDTLEAWQKANFPDALEQVTLEDLERRRFRQVRPRVGAEISLDANPVEVGLLETLPRGKGCYPGQEVIERMISQGTPARRLALIDGQGDLPATGAAVLVNGANAGTVTSVRGDGNGFQALAMIRKSSASEGVDVGFENAKGIIAKLSPLPSAHD